MWPSARYLMLQPALWLKEDCAITCQGCPLPCLLWELLFCATKCRRAILLSSGMLACQSSPKN